MTITFGGLATGIDTASIITQLVGLEKAPITRLEAKQTILDKKSNKLTSLKTKLSDLQTAARTLDTRSEALPSKATSSNESVVVATATGGASMGSFSVAVDRLASSARVYSDPISSRSASGLFGNGTLSLTLGSGTPTDIAVTASDTLDTVVAKIQASGADVSAGVLFDGTNYRLQISGNQTGSANALTIGETSLTLGVSDPGNVVSVAQDAQLRIDGHPVTSSSNTLTSAIPGVSLELRGVSAPGTSATTTVTRDDTALAASVTKLVDAFNAVNTFISAESAWTGTDKPTESLSGDSTLRSIQSAMRSAVIAPVVGATGKYTTLASLGISLSRAGALSVDQTKLKEALSRDPEAVAKVLGQSGTGAMSKVSDAVDRYTAATGGILTERLSSMSRQRKAMDVQIERIEARVDKYEEQLRSMYANLEKTVSGLQAQGNQLTAALTALEAK